MNWLKRNWEILSTLAINGIGGAIQVGIIHDGTMAMKLATLSMMMIGSIGTLFGRKVIGRTPSASPETIAIGIKKKRGK